MTGVLIVDKPKGITSRDVVNIISKKFSEQKVGHTGTLDPIATGVLVITIGKATKLTEELTSTSKEYIAEVILGLETDTLDITGNILNEDKKVITKTQIEKVIEDFPKEYNQEVPIYSAVKIKGKKLYEYARNNEKVILPKRMVKINHLELLDVYKKDNRVAFKIKTEVSKGTYIRSLVKDIALKLNTYGTMSELRRTKQGKFKIEDAYTMDEIKNNKYKLLGISEILDIPIIEVDDEIRIKILNGQKLENKYNKEKIIFYNKVPLAIYEKDKNMLKIDIMLYEK